MAEAAEVARTREEVLAAVRAAPQRTVTVAAADIDGVLRGKHLDRGKFLGSVDGGFGFCNVVFGWDSGDACYDNVAYTGWHSGYPDATARIDLATYRTVPWDGGVPFFLADFVGTDGAPLPICPRQALKRVLARAAEMGFDVRCGMEFEWFNFRETPESLAAKQGTAPTPLTPGMFGYSLVRMAQHRDYVAALLADLGAFGIPIEGLHTETGPGVYEAAILHAPALEAADRAVLFKTAVKEIASRFGILPSFMAKWRTDLPGCSGHSHQSLWRDGANAFHDARDPLRMSAAFRAYLAGILELLPEMLPFLAPTVNSYKRLVDGYWAPTRPTWGIDNRTVACRVIPGSPSATRLEVRVPGSDVNPYLAVAATVGAGLWGIAQGLTLRAAPVRGSAYAGDTERLPRDLQAATRRLKASQAMRTILGEALVDHVVATREWEWRQFQDAVTDWELRRYFEVI